MFRFLFGVILGIALVPLIAVALLYQGKAPVAVADPPLPYEDQIAHFALQDRINRELIQMPPIQPSAQVFIAGAHIYADKCAVCHGLHGKSASTGEDMYPSAPALWEKHHSSPVVGVSDDPPGETYWKVTNGIRLTGMPEFRHRLSDTEIWEVSLLLANADKPLPPEALTILRVQPSAGVPDTAGQLAPQAPSTGPDAR